MRFYCMIIVAFSLMFSSGVICAQTSSGPTNNEIFIKMVGPEVVMDSNITAKVLQSKPGTNKKETFGAEANPTGDPIGGGKGYRRIVSRSAADYQVKTLKELLAALKKAKAGQIVYVHDKAIINLAKNPDDIVIPAGVTLASGRGRRNSRGALFHFGISTTYGNRLEKLGVKPFRIGGNNVRITGLRLRGPDPECRTDWITPYPPGKTYYSIPVFGGIACKHSHLEVDNCELWGWSYAAVALGPGASKAHVHHNYIHHNQRRGLGYGVALNAADALIEANLFDWCRHHISGSGAPGTSFEARYNLVLENCNDSNFDMHGGFDRKDGTDIAGDSIKIHHNTFLSIWRAAVGIRGRPTQTAEIHHNWFIHANPKAATWQRNAFGNMNVYRNQYTADRIIMEGAHLFLPTPPEKPPAD